MLERKIRKATVLDQRLSKRLASYAAAAGISLAAAPPAAEAKIVYTPVDVTLSEFTQEQYTLLPDGLHPAVFLSDYTPGADFTNFTAAGVSGGEMIVSEPYNFSLLPLPARRIVGRKANFGNGAGIFYTVDDSSQMGSFGVWNNITAYFGFSFLIDGQTHYGWARMSVAGGDGYISATLTGYAYETVPGRAIRTGQIAGADETSGAADYSGALGALAFGAGGNPQR